jgi:hypothetical protein
MNAAILKHTMTAKRSALGLSLLAKPTLPSLKTKRNPASLNNAGLTHTPNIQGVTPSRKGPSFRLTARSSLPGPDVRKNTGPFCF